MISPHTINVLIVGLLLGMGAVALLMLGLAMVGTLWFAILVRRDIRSSRKKP